MKFNFLYSQNAAPLFTLYLPQKHPYSRHKYILKRYALKVKLIQSPKNTTNQNWERKKHLEDFNSRHNKIKELGKKKRVRQDVLGKT